MSSEPWTIESIRDALGATSLAQRFQAEIDSTPADDLLGVFAKWERIARKTQDAVGRGRELHEYHVRGEDLPGEWHDATERVQRDADRIRRGAA